MRFKKLILDVIIALFVLLFLYTAASKLLKYDKFQLQMSKSPVITDYANLLVWMVPLLEITISILLLIRHTVLLGLYSAFALMSVFTVYVILILKFSDNLPCSCGGVIEKMTWEQHLIFNTVFVGLALLGIIVFNINTESKVPKPVL